MKKARIIFLGLTVFFGCKEQDQSCFQCKTEVYVNGVESSTRSKSNLYCYMDDRTANYLESINELSYYDEEGNLIETKPTCKRISK